MAVVLSTGKVLFHESAIDKLPPSKWVRRHGASGGFDGYFVTRLLRGMPGGRYRGSACRLYPGLRLLPLLRGSRCSRSCRPQSKWPRRLGWGWKRQVARSGDTARKSACATSGAFDFEEIPGLFSEELPRPTVSQSPAIPSERLSPQARYKQQNLEQGRPLQRSVATRRLRPRCLSRAIRLESPAARRLTSPKGRRKCLNGQEKP